MQDEPITIYDQHGQKLGVRSRAEVHRTGLWHRAVNVLLFRSDGRLVVQQRSKNKDVCPGLWDLSVAEHLTPGETDAQAALRGLHEELGLQDVAVTPVGEELTATLTAPGIHDQEFQQTFQATSDQPLQFDPVEVAAVDEVTMPSLINAIAEAPERYTPWFQRVLSSLNYIP